MISHRETKKQQTRQALITSAYELFAQKGYNATTLADITKRANCAPRTFFQYFSAKDDLLLVGINEVWISLARALSERGDISTLETLRSWALKTTQEFVGGENTRLQVLDREVASASISAEARRSLYSMTRMQAVLVPELAKDLGVPADHAVPKLIAAATATIVDAYHSDPKLAEMGPEAFFDQALRLLSGMMRAHKT
jgi:AcrR family transcriptional regulator